jgi:hypothetical protein
MTSSVIGTNGSPARMVERIASARGLLRAYLGCDHLWPEHGDERARPLDRRTDLLHEHRGWRDVPQVDSGLMSMVAKGLIEPTDERFIDPLI